MELTRTTTTTAERIAAPSIQSDDLLSEASIAGDTGEPSSKGLFVSREFIAVRDLSKDSSGLMASDDDPYLLPGDWNMRSRARDSAPEANRTRIVGS